MKIVYRIVTALLALCIIPAAYFLSFLEYGIDAAVVVIRDDITLRQVSGVLMDKTSPINEFLSGSGNFFQNALVKSLMPAAISFLVFFAIALIVSLVIFFFAVLSNKRLVITCLAGGGLLAMIATYISFAQFTKPLLDGSITLASLIDTTDLSLLLNLAVQFVGSSITLAGLRLTSATVIMTLIFAVIMIWGLAYMLTEDESEKNARRLEKANKKNVKKSKKNARRPEKAAKKKA